MQFIDSWFHYGKEGRVFLSFTKDRNKCKATHQLPGWPCPFQIPGDLLWPFQQPINLRQTLFLFLFVSVTVWCAMTRYARRKTERKRAHHCWLVVVTMSMAWCWMYCNISVSCSCVLSHSFGDRLRSSGEKRRLSCLVKRIKYQTSSQYEVVTRCVPLLGSVFGMRHYEESPDVSRSCGTIMERRWIDLSGLSCDGRTRKTMWTTQIGNRL